MISKLIDFLLTSKKTQPLNSSGPKEEEGYYTWNKGEVISLSPYFSSKEFSCQCNFPSCKKQRISRVLVEKLGSVRKEIKQPLIVTSGFRCVEHQAFLRSAGVSTVVAQLSQHELGNAADIVPKDGKMEGFEEICAKQFDSIGLASHFLHVDLRNGRRRWKY